MTSIVSLLHSQKEQNRQYKERLNQMVISSISISESKNRNHDNYLSTEQIWGIAPLADGTFIVSSMMPALPFGYCHVFPHLKK